MACVQCKTGRARWQVENQPKHLFCTRACHATFMGLKIWHFQTETEIDNPDEVGLQTANGEAFVISMETAQKMRTVMDILERIGPSDYIPLPNISKNVLIAVLAFLRTETLPGDLEDARYFELMRAMDYLDIPLLYTALIPTLAERLLQANNEKLVREFKNYLPVAIYFLDNPTKLDKYREYFENEYSAIVNNYHDYEFEEKLNWAIPLASVNGHAAVVELLLHDDRFDPAAWGDTAIILACKHGHVAVVELLLNDRRVNPTEADNLAIQLASENGHAAVVERLLRDPRVNPAGNDNFAIQYASKYGHTSVVELLLKDVRVDPAADFNYAIRLASHNGHLPVVKLLLDDPRVDPSVQYNDAIRAASRNGYAGVVELLLREERVDPAAEYNESIRMASQNGYAEVVKQLLQDPRIDTTGIKLGGLRPDIRNLIEAHRRARARGKTGDESGSKRATLGRRVK
jgi:ankyrin repeat protein